MIWDLPDKQAQQIQANIKKRDAEKQRQRREKLTIPENVKKDSSEYVWYSLRNSILITQETIDNYENPADRFGHTPRSRRDYDRLQRFKLEQTLLEDLAHGQYRQAFEKEAEAWEEDLAKGKPHVKQLKNRSEYPEEFPPAATANEQLESMRKRATNGRRKSG